MKKIQTENSVKFAKNLHKSVCCAHSYCTIHTTKDNGLCAGHQPCNLGLTPHTWDGNPCSDQTLTCIHCGFKTA